MPGELDQPQAGASHAGMVRQDSEVNGPWVPGGVSPKAGALGPRSWIQKVLEQVKDSPLQWVTPSEVALVAVLAVQRYLLEDEPGDIIPKPSRYGYDVTISDGVYQEKCFLHPRLNFLVSKNILRAGIKMRIFRVSCLYNEKRLGQGILCIDNIDCGEETLDTTSLATPFRNSAHQEIPERPLRGGKSHYLALWNNEDPYGDIWLTNKQPEEYNFNKVCLNLRDPPTNINIIPEGQVKPEWRLPKLNHRFITRSELDDMPEKQICDVVGVLVFVGRVQRLKKKENGEDFWSYRWIHIADGTSEQPFIVELFSTSQPEIFENICPMTYFMCTQLKVVRNNNQVPKLLYLTTTNESQIFIIVQSLLTAISEVRKEIENLQYREQKRIAIQGIITIIKYIPNSSATGSSSASETVRNVNQPSTSQTAIKESQSQELDGKQHQDDGSVSCQTTCTSLSPPKKKRILQGPFAKLVPIPQPETSAQTRENIPDTPSIFQRRESASTGIKWKARKTLTHRWESQLWREKKFGLRDHLHYRFVYPESIPRKFIFEHKNFLIQQYNCQPAKYIAQEERPLKLSDFKSAQSLGHFEVTILGLNHERAIDVAFLPLHCPEDIRTSQIDTLLSCMNYSCVYPQEVTDSERMPGPRALAASFPVNAYVTVHYYNETSNYTTTETCECGVYGLASPVANAMGVVGIPKNNNYQACDYNTEFTNTEKPWIALIERGNCTFSEKIQTASRRNADAVVIYNVPETGNQTIQMANFGEEDDCDPNDKLFMYVEE
ncbi:Hypothetical protein D623_10027669 [Myotis brandtii]|uniref:PA domain-containing protein n=1 Tax=Myotis brandtii TaxID=109478 RepID=S7MZE8_MYOBR|nr:Hypothetical protein D623_10027669 [Myotis brandtii]